jgi:hypothetical protein
MNNRDRQYRDSIILGTIGGIGILITIVILLILKLLN